MAKYISCRGVMHIPYANVHEINVILDALCTAYMKIIFIHKFFTLFLITIFV